MSVSNISIFKIFFQLAISVSKNILNFFIILINQNLYKSSAEK